MKPIHLLLVDDELPFIEIISQRLRRRGFITACASDGQGALVQLDVNDSLEVVVLDVAMPGMDGLETLQRMKTSRPLVEIIMLTGQATINSAVEAIKLGAFDYLMKPCDLEELTAKIDQAAERKRKREAEILKIRMMPYISERERNELISRIMKP
jgi:DNA-binding NtrC family response regulator